MKQNLWYEAAAHEPVVTFVSRAQLDAQRRKEREAKPCAKCETPEFCEWYSCVWEGRL